MSAAKPESEAARSHKLGTKLGRHILDPSTLSVKRLRVEFWPGRADFEGIYVFGDNGRNQRKNRENLSVSAGNEAMPEATEVTWYHRSDSMVGGSKLRIYQAISVHMFPMQTSSATLSSAFQRQATIARPSPAI